MPSKDTLEITIDRMGGKLAALVDKCKEIVADYKLRLANDIDLPDALLHGYVRELAETLEEIGEGPKGRTPEKRVHRLGQTTDRTPYEQELIDRMLDKSEWPKGREGGE
jgi:hypothetical protein